MSKPNKKIEPEMNVTPLVDVVLVLLIIFMVIAPQMESGAPVNLPGILNPDPKNEGKTDPLTISIVKDGAIYWEKEKVERAEIETRLKTAHESNASRRIVLRADREVRYDAVRELFKIAQDTGFTGVSLQVGDRKQQQQQQKAGG